MVRRTLRPCDSWITRLISSGTFGSITTSRCRANPSMAAQTSVVRYSVTESRLIERRSSHHSAVFWTNPTTP